MEASALPVDTGILRAPGAPPVLLRLRSDEQLVALFRAGNEEAFSVICDRFQTRLLAYVRRMLPAGPRANAEDVLQDVYMRAYGALRADDRPVAAVLGGPRRAARGGDAVVAVGAEPPTAVARPEAAHHPAGGVAQVVAEVAVAAQLV